MHVRVLYPIRSPFTKEDSNIDKKSTVKMLKTRIFFTLLCSVIHLVLGVPMSNETIFSRVIETRLPNPVTLVVGSTLYTISKTKQTLTVNSTNVNCKLAVDPFDENIQGRMNAAPLGEAPKIVVWGIQKSQLRGDIRHIFYTLLIVDPVACNHKVVPLPEDEVPNSWPILQPQLIIENTNFLVFYPTQQTCDSCEFWNWGDRIDARNRQLPYHGGVPSSQFWIQPYDDEKVEYYNAFYAYNFDNGTALIEVLDMQKFEKGWRGLLDCPVNAASVSYGTYQNTAICSISTKNRQEIACGRLNARMEVATSWKLPLKNNLTVSDVSIKVDKVGNTFIGVIDSQNLHFFIYNVDAQLVAVLDFGQIDEKYSHRDVDGIRLGNEFCLVAVVYSDADAQDTHHVVKCIDTTKYLNGTWYNVKLV